MLAENISNSDTPKFQARDLIEPKFDRNGSSAPDRWGTTADDAHQRQSYCGGGGRQRFHAERQTAAFRPGPAGNAVNLEDQMLKVSANQMDYAAATSLYSRSLGLLKTPFGKTLSTS